MHKQNSHRANFSADRCGGEGLIKRALVRCYGHIPTTCDMRKLRENPPNSLAVALHSEHVKILDLIAQSFPPAPRVELLEHTPRRPPAGIRMIASVAIAEQPTLRHKAKIVGLNSDAFDDLYASPSCAALLGVDQSGELESRLPVRGGEVRNVFEEVTARNGWLKQEDAQVEVSVAERPVCSAPAVIQI